MAENDRPIGPSHSLYRTGKTHDGNGYVVLSSKEHQSNRGRREHRVVVENAIGRRLSSTEVVHHINGNKAENRLENLSVETRATHNRKHGKGKLLRCTKCGAERWYSPAIASRINEETYMCRLCRFGRTWNNGRKSNAGA